MYPSKLFFSFVIPSSQLNADDDVISAFTFG